MPSRFEDGTGSLVGIKAIWVAVCLLVLFPGCAQVASLRVYPDDVPAGSMRLAQVIAVATRGEIVQEKAYYEALLKSGIPDGDIRDGSLAVGRIYCCGGTAPNQAFFVPAGMQVQALDIVELRAGREPTAKGSGVVNTMTRVVQPAGASETTCRWVPPDPRLWMRVLYCDWMEKEGWTEQKETWTHTWLKRPETSGSAK